MSGLNVLLVSVSFWIVYTDFCIVSIYFVDIYLCTAYVFMTFICRLFYLYMIYLIMSNLFYFYNFCM